MTAHGRGWVGALGLTLVTALFSIVPGVLLIFLPLALMLVALPPRRPMLVAAGAVGLVLLVWGPTGELLVDFGRGWALVLGAWFLIACVVLGGERFLSRGLAAVSATVVTAGGFLWLNPGSFPRLDGAIRTRLQAGVDLLERLGWAGRSEAVTDALRMGAELQELLYPALLGIASLAGLAVAWWAYRRIALRDMEALGLLRDFRFGAGLVWLLIAGLVLALFPLNQIAERAGSNLLAFMAALYALRGVAVLFVVVGTPGPLGVTVALLLALLLYPVAMLVTFLVGLTDTWLDVRTRRGTALPPGS